MLIAKIENNAVTEVIDYRQKFNGVPSDELLKINGYKKVNLFKSHNSLTEKLVSCSPYIDGEFVTMVEVAPMTEEEVQSSKDSAMAQLRSNRNALLSQCDWTQLSDSPVDKAAWANYRQALRDFPSTVADARLAYEFPHNPNWVEPGV